MLTLPTPHSVTTTFKFMEKITDIEHAAMDAEGTECQVRPRLVSLAFRLRNKKTAVCATFCQTEEAVDEAFTSLKAFLRPGNVDQTTQLHTCGGEESNFLANYGISSKNLQDQDKDTLMSLCDACSRTTS